MALGFVANVTFKLDLADSSLTMIYNNNHPSSGYNRGLKDFQLINLNASECAITVVTLIQLQFCR